MGECWQNVIKTFKQKEVGMGSKALELGFEVFFIRECNCAIVTG